MLNKHALAHSENSSDPEKFTRCEAHEVVREVDELVQAALSYQAAILSRFQE
ncbi:hypothetical protein NBRC116590_03000 [Pelagimonas sp. KU-00592-HH]|uniref:hypothetical protein n=1 Tax=Pelagimonas sp. KU-00592-HH TaxID=3127651 RepID=UPI00310A0F6C